MSADDSLLGEWADEPEPSQAAMDPQVILDTNISGKAWLYDCMNENEAYLVYDGGTLELTR